jgi:hemerythrin
MIEWNKNISVGIKEFDTHHKRIIALINELDRVNEKEDDRKAAEDALSQLSNYCAYHFSAEESAMSIYKYPELAAHKEEHRAFIEKLFELTRNVNADKKNVTKELSEFLWGWFKNHILVTDKKYSEALLAAGMD